MQAHLGDANLDARVDSFDLNILAAHWQQAGRLWSAGDFTGDGKVDSFDLNILAANWQFTAPLESFLAALPPSVTPIPEPASILLFGSILLPLVRRRKVRPLPTACQPPACFMKNRW